MTGKSLHKTARPSSGLDEIIEALAPISGDPASACIFLDLDGTLAPIVPQPKSVAIPGPMAKLVRKLEHRYLAVAVVSGRPATEAKRIVGVPDLAYIGNHGFETLLPGHAVVVSEEARPFVTGIREIVDFCRSLEEINEKGIFVEDKTATMSLHYRNADNPEEARAIIMEKVVPQVEKRELKYSEGRMVLEVKPPVPVDKGVAIGRLLDRLDARRAVYMGDDTTDIDALKELRKRKRRKDSVMVGIGVISQEMPADLPKYADLMVDKIIGVETVLQILAGEEL